MGLSRNAAIVLTALLWSGSGLIDRALATTPTNTDELISHHLDSIASPAIRARFKTRVAQGPVKFKVLVGGARVLDGKAFLVSEGRKLQFTMELPNNDYRGEQFVFDGEKFKVAASTVRQGRSALGNFVLVQNAVVQEGLLGGVLSTAWPLLHVDERKAKLSLRGLKKIDGQNLYDVDYRPRKSSDLEIHLYFDPQTYRHVKTVYSYSVSSPGVNENRYRLEEKFGDFKAVGGVTVPTRDDIQFSQELQNGRSMLMEWDLKNLDVSNNVAVDARSFDVK
jgi:hypothetical protein